MSFDDKKVSKAKELFETKPLWQSLTYIILLAVLVGFLEGLYVFVSQLLMVNLLPNNPSFSNEAIYGIAVVDDVINNVSIIRSVNTITAPFISIALALSVGFGLGTSINYSKSLGAKKYDQAKEVYQSGFYTTIFFGMITSAIVIMVAFFVIPTQIGTVSQDSGIDQALIDIYRNTVITYARNYIFILIGLNFLQCLVQLLSTCLNSEGRNLIVTIILVSTTAINILVVFLLLKFSALGVLGGSIGIAIGWTASIILLYLYIFYLNKKDETLMNFSVLKKVKIQWWIFWLIFAIGSTSFLRNFSSIIIALINNTEIVGVTGSIGIFNENYFININGAVVPIYNLLLASIIGVVRGGRTIISYLYSAKQYEKVKKIFLRTTLMTVSIAIIMYLFGVFVIGDQLLYLFNFSKDTEENLAIFLNAQTALRINTLSLVTFSLGISGTLFFQAIGKAKQANISAIFQGIIIGVPTIYINAQVAMAVGGMAGTWLFYSSQVIAFAFSGICIMAYSFWYVYKGIDRDRSKDKKIDLSKLNIFKKLSISK